MQSRRKLILRYIKLLLRKGKSQKKNGCSGSMFCLLMVLPACGKRWSIIPAGATEPYLRMFSNVQVLRLAHPPAERTFYLVTPKGRALSAAAETLLEDLRVQIQDLEGITWY